MQNLYNRDSFINPNIVFLFNREIIEYDMKEAGFSLIQEYKLLPQRIIDELKKLPKEKRKIKIGVLQREDEKLRKELKEAFSMARERFFLANELEDTDIVSIKKDAIFTTKRCQTQEIGDFIVFRPKNTYTSYIQMTKNLEFYYSPTSLDVKGISDELLDLHKDYMLDFIRRFFEKMETESDSCNTIEFVKRFCDKYKHRELDVGYYREFNVKSEYHLLNDNTIFMEYWEDKKEDLDITYNYFNILMKLIRIPL